VANIASVADKTQLEGAMGVGWYPAIDTDQLTRTPEIAACKAFFDKRGLPSGRTAWSVCEQWNTMLRAVNAAGSLKADAIVAALPGLGTFVEAPSFRIGFTGRRDGMSAVAPTSWDAACACFVYLSKPYAVP
jgi:hypothetical protein